MNGTASDRDTAFAALSVSASQLQRSQESIRDRLCADPDFKLLVRACNFLIGLCDETPISSLGDAEWRALGFRLSKYGTSWISDCGHYSVDREFYNVVLCGTISLPEITTVGRLTALLFAVRKPSAELQFGQVVSSSGNALSQLIEVQR